MPGENIMSREFIERAIKDTNIKKLQVINDKAHDQKILDNVLRRLALVFIKHLSELPRQDMNNKKVFDQILINDAVRKLS